MVYKEGDVSGDQNQNENPKTPITKEELQRILRDVRVDTSSLKGKPGDFGWEMGAGKLRAKAQEELKKRYEVVDSPQQKVDGVLVEEIAPEKVDKKAEDSRENDLSLAQEESDKLKSSMPDTKLANSKSVVGARSVSTRADDLRREAERQKNLEEKISAMKALLDSVGKLEVEEQNLLSLSEGDQKEILYSIQENFASYSSLKGWIDSCNWIKDNIVNPKNAISGLSEHEKMVHATGMNIATEDFIKDSEAIKRVLEKLEEIKSRKVKKVPPKVPDKNASGLADAVKPQSGQSDNPNAGKPRPPLPPSMRKK